MSMMQTIALITNKTIKIIGLLSRIVIKMLWGTDLRCFPLDFYSLGQDLEHI